MGVWRAELQAMKPEVPCVLDDHQSPVKAELYVQLRLLVARDEYKAKIPRCYARRRFWEFVLTACTVASASLSYIRSTASYVAISSAVAAAVTSWKSHDELTRRTERYSNAVRDINDLVWWWKSLDDPERANTSYIARLVETGESILGTEQRAWSAAATSRDEEGAGSAGAHGMMPGNKGDTYSGRRQSGRGNRNRRVVPVTHAEL